MVFSLQKYGFSQEKCIRALAFTGFRTVRLAAFWLCCHINDPILTTDTVQDFFVLMCLEGELSSRLSDFLFDARNTVDWSSTLDAPLSVAILHFEVFSVTTPEIHRILQSTTDSIRILLSKFNPSLEFCASSDPCFIGYCFRDPSSGILLDELSKTLSSALIGADINVRILPDANKDKTTATKSVSPFPQLTLAQAFPPDQLSTLLGLHDACLANTSVVSLPQWSIRLYSRDPRLRVPDPEVYEMLTTVECDSLSYSEQRASAAFNLLPDCTPTDNFSADHSPTIDLGASPQITENGRPTNSPTVYSKPSASVTTPDVQLHAGGDKQLFPLAHQAGDCVLLLASCGMPGRQGCPLGLNLSTGATGVFNLLAGRRVPQYVTWALHGSIPVRGQIESIRVNRKSPHQVVVNQSCSQLPSESERDEQLLASTSPERSRQPSQQSSVSSPAFKLKDSLKESGHPNTVTNGRHFSSSSASTNSSLSNTSCSGSRCFALGSEAPLCAERIGALWASSASYVPNPFAHTQACAPSSLTGPSGFDFYTGSSNSQYLDSNGAHPNGCAGADAPQTTGPLRQSTRSKSRQLFVMRHAERVDICFGRGWITRCFDKKGVYRRFNLNLPPWLPPRADYMDYALDSPITQVGLFVSAETGRSLAEAGVQFTACYSSPSFRCVQTACELLRAMGRSDMLVRIEPHLFEWLGWYSNCVPRMMSPHELHSCGYSVDVDYRPLSSSDYFDTSESIASYYERSGNLTKRLLALHKSKDVCILIVAHASSLDTCTHQLIHHGFRTCISPEEFHRRTTGVPYCAMVVAEAHRRWTLVDPPVPAVCSYAHNPDFDWKQLVNGRTLCGFRIR